MTRPLADFLVPVRTGLSETTSGDALSPTRRRNLDAALRDLFDARVRAWAEIWTVDVKP